MADPNMTLWQTVVYTFRVLLYGLPMVALLILTMLRDAVVNGVELVMDCLYRKR